jgi:formylglycine-generating enzyme required for sulfatase activity
MTCVDWFLAFAFCAWDDARLPTEAEYNFAAAAGDQQRAYPWGAAAPSSAYAVYGCELKGSGCVPSDLPGVGSRSPLGDGLWHHSDLAGSVNEWVLDAYGPYATECIDCALLGAGNDVPHVKRGEGWRRDTFLSTTGRDSDLPLLRDAQQGFRCAK